MYTKISSTFPGYKIIPVDGDSCNALQTTKWWLVKSQGETRRREKYLVEVSKHLNSQVGPKLCSAGSVNEPPQRGKKA